MVLEYSRQPNQTVYSTKIWLLTPKKHPHQPLQTLNGGKLFYSSSPKSSSYCSSTNQISPILYYFLSLLTSFGTAFSQRRANYGLGRDGAMADQKNHDEAKSGFKGPRLGFGSRDGLWRNHGEAEKADKVGLWVGGRG